MRARGAGCGNLTAEYKNMNIIHEAAAKVFADAGIKGIITFSVPPNPDMGDLAFGCFSLAKEAGKNPKEVAEELAAALLAHNAPIIETVVVAGPYVNIKLNAQVWVPLVMGELALPTFGMHIFGKKKKILIEYACPNPLKAFHLGHLKNLITGESVVRVFENAGYDVMRVNYQGDVGMHVAKALWGMNDWILKFEAAKKVYCKFWRRGFTLP